MRVVRRGRAVAVRSRTRLVRVYVRVAPRRRLHERGRGRGEVGRAACRAATPSSGVSPRAPRAQERVDLAPSGAPAGPGRASHEHEQPRRRAIASTTTSTIRVRSRQNRRRRLVANVRPIVRIVRTTAAARERVSARNCRSGGRAAKMEHVLLTAEGPYVRRLVEGARGAARRVARLLRRAPHARGRGRPPQGRRRRPGVEGHVEEDGRRRLRRCRLAEGVGRPGPHAHRAVRLLRRVDARRRAGADAHDQLGRADDHALRQRGAEAVLRAEDPRRARSTSRSATPSPTPAPTSRRCKTQGRARRRRVRDQRPEGVHEPRERRRLHLARGAHRTKR